MCNIAGYVGTRRAAPILIEMIRRQEGLAGGYYTGLATIHEGRIHYAKLTGDTDRLLAETNAASLPGTIGIIHSRSKAGGGDEWAHPFVDAARGDPTIAYVANGSLGCFAHRQEEFCALSAELIDAGYPMLSRARIDHGKYPRLPDGTTVHMSDAMCQLIARNIDRGLPPAEAMEAAFCTMPSEIVGLLLALSEPDSIAFTRINMPMNLAFADHGAYLGSAALAFPDDGTEPQALPPCSTGRVWRDRVEISPYRQPPAQVAAIDAAVRADAYAAILAALAEGIKSMSELNRAIRPCFGAGDCKPTALLGYDIVAALLRQGRITAEIRRVEGAFPHLDAPKTYFSLNT